MEIGWSFEPCCDFRAYSLSILGPQFEAQSEGMEHENAFRLFRCLTSGRTRQSYGRGERKRSKPVSEPRGHRPSRVNGSLS
jgi:hypothetical protein